MKALATSIIIAGVMTLAIACATTNSEGVILPYPNGNQYSMSDVCLHIEEQGYNVSGTINHTFTKDDFDSILKNIPMLARKPLENYLSNDLTVQVKVNSLCKSLNR